MTDKPKSKSKSAGNGTTRNGSISKPRKPVAVGKNRKSDLTVPRHNAMDETGLTEFEHRLVDAYMRNGGHQAAAFKECHPTAANWQPEAIYSAASQAFAMTRVRIRIAQLRAESAARTAITTDKVLQQAFNLAFSDTRKLFGPDGTLLMPHQWPDDIAAAVASVDVVEDSVTQQVETVDDENNKTTTTTTTTYARYTKKVKLWDKNPALDKLFRHMGLYERDNLQKNPILADLAQLPLPLLMLLKDKLRESAGAEYTGRRDSGDNSGNGPDGVNTLHH